MQGKMGAATVKTGPRGRRIMRVQINRRAAMNKGINRNVIEIVETDCEMFERAILFVRPHGQRREQAALESGAQRFLSRTKIRRRALTGRNKLCAVVKYALAAAAGAGAAVLTLLYILPAH